MKKLSTYIVTMRTTNRQQMHRTVTACVSPEAACVVANILYSRSPFSYLTYRANWAYQVS